MMWRACSRCGQIHSSKVKCKKGIVYRGGQERELRNKSAWHRKSEEIRERASYLCEVCKDRGVYTYKGLEVHHIEKLKDDADGLLDNYNLVCLCVEHHKQADKGDIDKGYLRELAQRREDSEIPRGGQV